MTEEKIPTPSRLTAGARRLRHNIEGLGLLPAPAADAAAAEILNRLNEMSFNAVLLKELRMMALLRQVANPGDCEGAQWAGMCIRRIASEMMMELSASSKLNPEWEFFTMLHKEGRRTAQAFLDAHAAGLGQRSKLDLYELLERI